MVATTEDLLIEIAKKHQRDQEELDREFNEQMRRNITIAQVLTLSIAGACISNPGLRKTVDKMVDTALVPNTQG